MMMNRIYNVLLILMVLAKTATAQDVRFSQYNYTPQVINPAVIATDDYFAGFVDYRVQNFSEDLTFKTVSVFGKHPIFNKNGERKAAFGLGFLSDRGEGLGDINLNGLFTNFAYNFKIANKWSLSTGVGLNYSRREASLDNFTTGNQWVPNIGFIADANNGESFQNLTTSFISVNGGLQFYQSDAEGDVKHYLGVSLFNANQPDESFIDNTTEKPLRYSLQAGVRVYENDQFSISPELIAEEQAENQFVGIGLNFTYHLTGDNPYDPIGKGSLNFKVRNTIGEAIIFGVQLDQPNFSVGFSYDLGISSDSFDPNTNATEFAFGIKKRLVGKKKKPARVVDNYSIKEIRQFYKKQPENNKADSKTSNETNGNGSSENATSTEVESGERTLQFELKHEFKFGFNESILDGKDKLYLDDLANLMKLNPNVELEIVGHADNIGTEKANKKISVQRAKTVEKYLVESGIAKKRIKSLGMGAQDPLVSNNSEANRAKNRRVEFIIYKK